MGIMIVVGKACFGSMTTKTKADRKLFPVIAKKGE
jgi:hypothetical protein